MFDLAIVGGGPGGYTAAIRAAREGLNVVLVEKDALGGTCLNRGCIPTKSFYYDARLFQAARTSAVLTGTDGLGVDHLQRVNRKRRVVKTLVSGLEAVVRSHGITVMNGSGALTAPGRVRVLRADGREERLEARHVLLATGSKPAVPSFIDVDGTRVQTTDEALDDPSAPGEVVIIGAGVIGIEMASVYLNLGCRVTLVEMLPDLLMSEDEDVRVVIRGLLRLRGVPMLFNAAVREVRVRGDRVAVSVENGEGALKVLESDRVLVATGRAPVFHGIDPDRLGLAREGPFVRVNETFETSVPGVFAVGDLVGGLMLAHKASAEAEAVVEHLLGRRKTVRPERIPRCIWGIQEIGAVGLSEAEARAAGREIRVGRFSLNGSGAAHAMGEPDGLVKVVGDRESGEILGVHIVGPHATDLIGEAASLMTMEAAVEDLAEAVKPHPTMSEAVMEAAMDWSGRAVHALFTR